MSTLSYAGEQIILLFFNDQTARRKRCFFLPSLIILLSFSYS